MYNAGRRGRAALRGTFYEAHMGGTEKDRGGYYKAGNRRKVESRRDKGESRATSKNERLRRKKRKRTKMELPMDAESWKDLRSLGNGEEASFHPSSYCQRLDRKI